MAESGGAAVPHVAPWAVLPPAASSLTALREAIRDAVNTAVRHPVDDALRVARVGEDRSGGPPDLRGPLLAASTSTSTSNDAFDDDDARATPQGGRHLFAVQNGGPPTTTPPPAEPDEVEDDHREVWTLVDLARGGDGEAFGKIYDRYFDVVYRYVVYRVSDRTLAEDLTSETFLRALRRISSVTYQGRDIGAWFVTIARNLILDHVKSARSRLESTTDEIGLVGDHAPTTVRPATPEALVLDAETSATLMGAIDTLGAEQRECVLLRFVQGFSVSETAEIMGKNDGAIKALQHRAVRKLATLVGDSL